jgi:hypothetical protein
LAIFKFLSIFLYFLFFKITSMMLLNADKHTTFFLVIFKFLSIFLYFYFFKLHL